MKTIISSREGFTLAELIVVIVVIGLLATIAIPKMSFAIGKAKAAEVPSVMAKIGQAEFMHYQESNTYADVPYNNWHTNLNSILGIEIQKGLFSYYVTDADPVSFLAHAKVEVIFAGIPNNTVEVTMDQIEQIDFVNDDGHLASYLRAWAN